MTFAFFFIQVLYGAIQATNRFVVQRSRAIFNFNALFLRYFSFVTLFFPFITHLNIIHLNFHINILYILVIKHY